MRKPLAAVLVAALATVVLGSAHADPTYSTQRSYVRSFDGTKIVYNLFEPDPAVTPGPWPIIFEGHGWGGTGDTNVADFTWLLSQGYAALTWDSRGFGASGGSTYVDDPAHEARDVSALINLVARRPEIAKDAPNDPTLGMIGGSYAGGIQLVTSAFDPRVDAIVPQITWNDLRYSLFPNGVTKLGWDELLYADGLATSLSGGINPNGTAGIQTGSYSTDLHRTEIQGLINGAPNKQTSDWFLGRSVAGYGVHHPVHIPTLFMQGDVDTLFNINEAVANWHHVLDHGAPAKLMIFCGGHVGCPSNYVSTGESDYLQAAALKWFDKYVKRESSVDTGAPVEYLTNDGVWHAAATFESAHTTTKTVTGSGMLVSTGAKTSIINGAPVQSPGLNSITTAYPSDPSDPGTLTIDTGIVGAADGSTAIVGIPSALLNVTLQGLGTHLFLKLVDVESNQVVDLQEAAVRIQGQPTGPIALNMVGVDYVVPAGHHIQLQISTSSAAMEEYRGASIVNLAASVQIPLL